MIIYQDDTGAYVAQLNRRVSGGHKTAREALAAVVHAEIQSYTVYDPETGEVLLPPDVEVIRIWGAEFINTYAGELRTKIGTDIPFQGDVYQLKEVEAKAFATDNAPDAVKYPVMFAEAAARQMKPADVAAEYLHNSQAWPVLLAQIEAVRLGSLSKLQAAKSIADIEAVLGALE